MDIFKSTAMQLSETPEKKSRLIDAGLRKVLANVKKIIRPEALKMIDETRSGLTLFRNAEGEFGDILMYGVEGARTRDGQIGLQIHLQPGTKGTVDGDTYIHKPQSVPVNLEELQTDKVARQRMAEAMWEGVSTEEKVAMLEAELEWKLRESQATIDNKERNIRLSVEYGDSEETARESYERYAQIAEKELNKRKKIKEAIEKGAYSFDIDDTSAILWCKPNDSAVRVEGTTDAVRKMLSKV